jgi:GTP-binding protein HflX
MGARESATGRTEQAGGFHVVRDSEPERGFVIAALPHTRNGDDELDEMRELLRTAGVETVGALTQKRERPHQRMYLGPGKVDELKERLGETSAEVVVCDDELMPAQQRALEDATQMRVVDRTAVILDIFADHAHTAEGKLQVELAQLQYNLQRMRGMWKHLERLGGGVGTRGPGESQLETDRRLARDRIALLKRRLREAERHRETQRKERARSEAPAVALVGYTNVGKSSLLNRLTGAGVSAADRLFETLDSTTRAYEWNGRSYTLTDTVGFIRKLPHQLVDAFASTLEETLRCDLLLHVIDASADDAERLAQMAAVERVLGQIDAGELPRMLVANKIDRLTEEEREEMQTIEPSAVLVSARTGAGIPALEERIAEHFAERFQEVELLVPHAEGAALARLYALGAPIERLAVPTGVLIRAHLPTAEASRLQEFRVDRGTFAAAEATAAD